MLTAWLQTSIGSTPTIDPNAIFLFDPATNTDLVTGQVCGAYVGGAVADSSITIDGHATAKMDNVNAGIGITFPKPLNLEALPEWTIEWSDRPTNIRAYYANELLLTTSNSVVIGGRWTDGGFLERLQFTLTGFGNVNTIWRLDGTKAATYNVVNRYAMVFKDGRMSVYQNGVKQMMQNSTYGSGTRQDYIPKGAAWANFVTMALGFRESTNASFIGNYGRVRISDRARYTSDYTPQPF